MLIVRKTIAGTFGGVCQALCSAPLDFAKTRMQAGTAKTFREAVSGVSVSTIFAAQGPNVCLSGIFNSVLFSTNTAAKELVKRAFGLPDSGEPMPLRYVSLASALAAPIPVLIVTPADLIRVNMQTAGGNKRKSMFTVLREIVADGGVSALGRGYSTNIAMRCVALPAYFGGEQTCRAFYGARFPSHSDFVVSLVSGGFAGVCFWALACPLERVKILVQAQKDAVKQGPVAIAKQLYIEGGIRTFYRGISVVLLRAVPANASVFAGVSVASSALESRGW
jgi:hypothetical protein